jgi:hypothetical protein
VKHIALIVIQNNLNEFFCAAARGIRAQAKILLAGSVLFGLGAFIGGYALSFTGLFQDFDDAIGLPATEWYIENYGPN